MRPAAAPSTTPLVHRWENTGFANEPLTGHQTLTGRDEAETPTAGLGLLSVGASCALTGGERRTARVVRLSHAAQRPSATVTVRHASHGKRLPHPPA